MMWRKEIIFNFIFNLITIIVSNKIAGLEGAIIAEVIVFLIKTLYFCIKRYCNNERKNKLKSEITYYIIIKK